MSKRTRKTLWKLAVFILLTIILSGASSVHTVQARAGGGGRGGSSSGGSRSSGSGGHSWGTGSGSKSGTNSDYSYSHYSHRYNRHFYNRDHQGNLTQTLIIITVLLGSTVVAYLYKTQKGRVKSRIKMHQYSKKGGNWDFDEIQREVTEAYFKIQECWRRQDASYGKDYMSEACYDNFQLKLEWIRAKNERVIQDNVKLLNATPVDAHDDYIDENDQIWFLIHGEMLGYYMDRTTKMITRGSLEQEEFFEYWSFVYRDQRWVLDEIKQQNEMNLNS